MNLLIKLILVLKEIENFPTAILDRLGYRKGEIVYNLRKSKIKFIARGGTEDLSEIAVVASGSEYRLDLIKLSRYPTIIDLGGHIGSFSIPLAKKLKNKCNIYTFEPDKENFDLLKRNIKLNNISSIKIFNLAIGDFNGKGFLKTKNMNNDAYYLDDIKKNKPNCEIKTIEFAVSKIKAIDLIKMDIEGGEYRILNHKSSLKFIAKNVNYIFIEHHPINKRYNGEYVRNILSKYFDVIFENTNTYTFKNKKVIK